MNTPVTFEIAKSLKEKGFDLSCDSCYSEHDKTRTYNRDYIREGLIISAPTIAEVVMWFYEKNGWWISVTKDWDDGKCLGFESMIETNGGFVDCGTFKTPTEAYLSAIEFILKYLI